MAGCFPGAGSALVGAQVGYPTQKHYRDAEAHGGLVAAAGHLLQLSQAEVRHGRERLSAFQMPEVFQTSTDNVSLHLRKVYATGELEEAATVEDFSVVRSEGQRKVRRRVRHYNLDAIISIGYRVNSKRPCFFPVGHPNFARTPS
ncbi:MAG: virulence RhuM family protein [Rhodospirillales bacterium]|nr:virulence RhuM family protein [Rhodospirillales bacterium]